MTRLTLAPLAATAIFALLLSTNLSIAGSPLIDFFKGSERLAAEDDAYCKSIGARGSDYTRCRMFMTEQRNNEHAAARAGAADAMQGVGNRLQSRPAVNCTSTGSYSYRTTTCY